MAAVVETKSEICRQPSDAMPIDQDDLKFVSLIQLKREVKQIMEESVTKKHISEEGGTVTSLCAAVEACLVHGLKRRVFGLFGTSSTFALLHKISNACPPAASILRMVIQIEQKYVQDQKRNNGHRSSLDSSSNFFTSKRLPSGFRYLWIRLALFEKLLASIVEFISKNATKYYEKTALMADPVVGNMVSALMVGPCALEYSKMKTLDHYWTDPPADELLQRHRIHNRASFRGQPTSPKTPAPTLQVKRAESLGGEDANQQRVSSSARECVMSLHQNAKSTLLYGKNNVNVFPGEKEDPMGGYLSLHQNSRGALIVKWTPNELMNNNPTTEFDFTEKGNLWKHAMCLNVRDVVYLHCHSHSENKSGGSVVFVGADGVQHPPIRFPIGQHMLAFLSCLETGLLPWGQLDPPLWSQRGKGKVFPKLQRQSQSKASLMSNRSADSLDEGFENDISLDFVFRILPIANASSPVGYENSGPKKYTVLTSNGISNAPPSTNTVNQSKLVKLSSFSSRLKERFISLSSSPDSTPPQTPRSIVSSRNNSIQSNPPLSPELFFDARSELPATNEGSDGRSTSISVSSDEATSGASPSRKTLKSVCDSMRHQILSRAFYGWLAHCRHIKTIRTHLACLVNHNSVPSDAPCDATVGLTKERWTELRKMANDESLSEMYRLIYFGGVERNLRADVWPYLLGFYPWHDADTSDDVINGQLLNNLREIYETLMTEWMSVEAIVRERDREAFLAARVDTRYAEIGSIGAQNSLPNDVFIESDDDDPDSSSIGRKPSSTSATSDEHQQLRNRGSSTDYVCHNRVSVASRESGFVSQDSVPLSGTDFIVMEPLLPPNSLPFKTSNAMTSSDIKTPEEGDGGIFSKELVDVYALNLHRIERDVHRCDRNYYYFTNKNLDKLKNIMCTYVWEHLDVGYVQGMCDLAAPLLVILDDEVLTYGCFNILMARMTPNFAHGGGMDVNLANMRSLLQAMDPEFYEFMHKNGDYTHFYFCYRWFLLDFKREYVYDDVFFLWETIWAALHVASKQFGLFLALALMETYRDIIIDNDMDFTDIIKFFNEMAERHEASNVIGLARDLVRRLQKAIENNS